MRYKDIGWEGEGPFNKSRDAEILRLTKKVRYGLFLLHFFAELFQPLIYPAKELVALLFSHPAYLDGFADKDIEPALGFLRKTIIGGEHGIEGMVRKIGSFYIAHRNKDAVVADHHIAMVKRIVVFELTGGFVHRELAFLLGLLAYMVHHFLYQFDHMQAIGLIPENARIPIELHLLERAVHGIFTPNLYGRNGVIHVRDLRGRIDHVLAYDARLVFFILQFRNAQNGFHPIEYLERGKLGLGEVMPDRYILGRQNDLLLVEMLDLFDVA